MKAMQGIAVAGLLAAFAVTGFAQSQPLHIYNRLRAGWDDNIYNAEKDEVDSARIVEEIEVKLNLALERMYLGIDYRPSVLWIPERESDETDFLHDLTASLSYALTPNLVFSIKDNLRASQLPELENEGYRVRADDDNYSNSALATLAYNILPQTRIDLSGRYAFLEYDDDEKDYDNYWMAVGGVSLRQQLASHTTVFGDFRYQRTEYPDVKEEKRDRDADSIYGGLGLEQTFSQMLIGNVRVGVENRQYDREQFDDNTKPYFDASLTFMPTPDTRLTLAGGYSISESDLWNYASQNRYTVAVNLAHDFSDRLTLYANGSVAFGRYEADYALDSEDENVVKFGDADEQSYSAGARFSYKVGQINWLELGYTFVSLSTDAYGREDYSRNRADIGWKIQLY